MPPWLYTMGRSSHPNKTLFCVWSSAIQATWPNRLSLAKLNKLHTDNLLHFKMLSQLNIIVVICYTAFLMPIMHLTHWRWNISDFLTTCVHMHPHTHTYSHTHTRPHTSTTLLCNVHEYALTHECIHTLASAHPYSHTHAHIHNAMTAQIKKHNNMTLTKSMIIRFIPLSMIIDCTPAMACGEKKQNTYFTMNI